MEKKKKFQKIIEELKNVPKEKIFTFVVENLSLNFENYDWVGFYLVKDKKLHLDLFKGEPTIHTVIKFGDGICGQAAKTKKTFIISDVSKETNYLSCSTKVKSEIVIPIFNNKNELIGELDIDSHSINAFSGTDKSYLEKICEIIGKNF